MRYLREARDYRYNTSRGAGFDANGIPYPCTLRKGADLVNPRTAGGEDDSGCMNGVVFDSVTSALRDLSFQETIHIGIPLLIHFLLRLVYMS